MSSNLLDRNSSRISGLRPRAAGRVAASLAALLAGVSASAAIAQDRSAHEQSNDPDQIVVYGSKIASTLDDTHASVAVVTADDIEDREILSFRSAFRMMGNVLDGDWADAGFIIRGVNSEGLTPGGGALASVYVDGVRQTVNGARRGLEITHEFSPALTLTSMTSYSASDTQRPSVNEGTPGETEVTAGGFDQDLFSQELRLNYNQGAVRAVLGGYLEVEDANAGYSRVAFGRTDVSRSTSKATNMAIFGELAYEVIPSLEVIAGGRGDYTKTKSTAFFSRNNVVSTNTATSGDEFVFLPKVGLTKKLGDRQSLGFSVQRGFRGGGQVFQRSTGTVRDFDPEYTWTYELSYKGSFLDNKLRVSANAFYTDWKDQQVEVRENPLDFTSSYITNAAKSELYGFELEARGELSKELSAFASVGHVKTEFKDFVDLTLGNLTGMAFPEAPEWNLAFGMNYECACGFFVGADAKYVSDYQSRIDFAPHERLDGYWVANAQVGFRARHWEIMLFAENLFDNTYYVSDSQTDLGGGLLGDVARTLGARRSYGVHLTGRF